MSYTYNHVHPFFIHMHTHVDHGWAFLMCSTHTVNGLVSLVCHKI